jgi:hypothetical protein
VSEFSLHKSKPVNFGKCYMILKKYYIIPVIGLNRKRNEQERFASEVLGSSKRNKRSILTSCASGYPERTNIATTALWDLILHEVVWCNKGEDQRLHLCLSFAKASEDKRRVAIDNQKESSWVLC